MRIRQLDRTHLRIIWLVAALRLLGAGMFFIAGCGAIGDRDIDYQLDGTVEIDAGRFGQPTFGRMRLVEGEINVRR